MQGDEIGPRQQIVQFHLFHAHFRGAFFRQEGVIGDDFHLQPQRAVGNDRADVPRTNQAKGFVGDLGAHKTGFFPFASLSRGVGLGQLPRNGEHQGDGVFGSGDRVAKRRVHHDHTLFRGGGNVDVVHPDTGTGNNLQVFGGIQQFCGGFGGRADGKAVIGRDRGQQGVFVFAKVGHEINIDATVAENLNGSFREFVGDEYFGCHC